MGCQVPSGSKGGRSPAGNTLIGAWADAAPPTTFGAASDLVIEGGRCGGVPAD